MKKAFIICGPTASGKTEMAHQLALNCNGEIINCDSMQLYKEIPVITASPSKTLQQQVPYHLYNFLNIDQEFSFVTYAQMAAEKIKDIEKQGRLPIMVGGGGMYINSLLYGYSFMPEISPEVRKYVRALQAKAGKAEFFANLKKLDPQGASNINPEDAQRAIRAFEVFQQTNKSINFFQKEPNIIPLQDFNFKVIFLHPERSFLHHMCNERLEELFRNGAIEEVKAVKEKYEKLDVSAMKAVGIQEILKYLTGTLTLQEAITLAQARTRQYAKRQITWFQHQIKEKTELKYSDREEFKQLVSSYKL